MKNTTNATQSATIDCDLTREHGVGVSGVTPGSPEYRRYGCYAVIVYAVTAR